MTPETKNNLVEWAIAFDPTQPTDEILPQSQQLAIAIYKELPADGSYIKANKIATNLKRKSNQIKEILGLIREPWKLKTNRSRITGGYGK